jgi:hypothetical protein
MRRTIQLSRISEEGAIRAGEFQLTADTVQLPLIVSQLTNNFKQFTWLEDIRLGTPIFQYIKIESNRVLMLEGTEFILGLEAADLSNTLNINDTTNLSYKWTRDESPIYELNNIDGGIGTSTFLVSEASSSADLTGRYVCEVSNTYGAVVSDPIDIEIIDPLKHPKLLKNLILNGDGDGGLNGWQADTSIKITTFISNPANVKDFGSFRLGGWTPINGYKLYEGVKGTDLIDASTSDFYFTTGDDRVLFYNGYKKRSDRDPSFITITSISSVDTIVNGSPILSADEKGYIEWNLPQIIPNEDFEYDRAKPYAAFYPGIRYLDAYNKNVSANSTTLQNEYDNYQSQYFTRDRVRFEKLGDSPEVQMTQTVDVSEVSEMIDGRVYGVKYVSSQFFAYVGAGITGYNVKVTTADGIKTYNYYLKDLETYYNQQRLSTPPVYAYTFTNFNYYLSNYLFVDSNFGNMPPNELVGTSALARAYNAGLIWNGQTSLQGIIPPIKPLQGTPIEITPLVEDTTSVVLEYLDEFDVILKTETINGPSDRDVWAIKEKVYFPLTLYGLYECIIPSNNPITVFGQTYTTTDAIRPLFSADLAPYNIRPTINGSQNSGIGNQFTDVNAKFLLNKYNFTKYDSAQAYPNGFGFDGFNNAKKWRAVQDFGAAAMFGVGKNIVVPSKTRSIRLTVKFKNITQAIKDNSPRTKGWADQEIYVNDLGDGAGIGMRSHEYGNPRCGITSIKFLLSPNDFEINENYTSYQLPPANQTVIGIQKAKYTDPNAFNSAIKTNFTYPLEIPQGVPMPTQPVDPYINLQGTFDLLNGINLNDLASLIPANISGSLSDFGFGEDTSLPDSSVDAEDPDGVTP